MPIWFIPFRKTLLSLLLGLWTFKAFAHPDITEMILRLNEIPTIRVLMTPAPGNGNQAANVTLLKQLRAWGYRGALELYYADQQGKVKQKLEYLLPPFQASGPECQMIADLNVKVCAFRPGETQLEPVSLAITAADDHKISAQKVSAKNLLVLQPRDLSGAAYIESEAQTRPLKSFKNHPLRSVDLEVSDLEHFVTSEMSHSQKLYKKMNAVEALLRRVGAREIDMLSAYGLGMHGERPLANILGGLVNAQDRMPGTFAKPIFIALLSNLNDQEWDNVRSESRRNHMDWNRVRILNVEDSAAVEHALLNPDASVITIVKIGNLTQNLWNYFMLQSKLPPVAAGYNGVNFLAQMGRPYLVTTEAALDARGSMLKDLQVTMASRLKHNIDNPTLFGNFFISSQDPNSNLVYLFRQYAESLRELSDRHCAALLASQDVWFSAAQPDSTSAPRRPVKKALSFLHFLQIAVSILPKSP